MSANPVPRPLLESRWRAVSEALEREGFDALLVAGRGLIGQYGDVFWLTGFPLFNSVGHGYALMKRGETPQLVVGKRDQELASGFGIEEFVVRGSVPDAPAVGGTGLIALAAQALEEHGLARGRLVIAGLDLVMPAGDWLALRELLPELELSGAGALLARLKAVKSPQELELYAEAVELCDRGWERFLETVEPGRTEAALAAEIERVVRELGALATIIHVLGGRMYTKPPTQRALVRDEVVCCYVETVAPNGYWVEKGGVFVLGDPPPRSLEVLDTAERAYVEGERLLTPGRPASEIAAAIEAVAREGGCETGIWSGHGVGVDHDLPLFNGHDDTPLEAGMVVSLHPHVCDDRYGSFVLDQFTITREGPVRHSRFPRERHRV